MANTQSTITTVMTMNNTRFKQGLKGSQRALSGFQKQMQQLKGMIIGTFAVGAVINFGRTAFQALDTQKKAEAQLLTALKGKEDVQQRLIQQAQTLQKVTLFGDEETIAAQAMIAAFVKEEEAIKKVIPLVQDLATAKGMNLVAAADLVSKTLGSSTNALSRYGITVEGAVGSVERLESLVNGLTSAFEGQAAAAAAADTTLTQLKNEWGDVKESFAEFVMRTGVGFYRLIDNSINPALGTMERILRDAAQEAEEMNKQFDKFVEKAKKMSSSPLAQSWMIDWRTWMEMAEQTRDTGPPHQAPPNMRQTHHENAMALREGATNPYLPGAPMSWSYLWQEDPEEIIEEDVDGAIAEFERLEKAFEDLKDSLEKSIGQLMLSYISDFGEAIGSMVAGVKYDFERLGQTIMENIGNIMLLTGIQMMQLGTPEFIAAGAGLALGGGLLQLGSGIWRGASKDGSENEILLRARGNDLVGTISSQAAYRNHAT